MSTENVLGEKMFRFLRRNACQERGGEEECFCEFAKAWLGNVKFHVKESSYVKYYNLVENHILPQLGQVKITDFTTKLVEDYIEEKLKNGKLRGKGGLSEKTVRDILVVLKEICLFARRQNVDFPCHLELIKVRAAEPEIQVLSYKEQMCLEEFLMEGDELTKTGILLSLYMGLRIGEVCALQRKHIRFDSGILEVRGTMQRIQDFSGNAGMKTKVVVTDPKSFSSKRDIPIPEFLMERLRKLEDSPEKVYLLSGEEENFVEPRTMENIFKSYLKQCRMRPINYHALRHTFATRCVENGVDVKSLSEILGHANVNITLNKYVHSSMDQKRRSMAKVCLVSECS